MGILDVAAGAGEGLQKLLENYRADELLRQRNQALIEEQRSNKAREGLEQRRIDEATAARGDTVAQRLFGQLESAANKREAGYGVSAKMGPTGPEFTPTDVPRPEALMNQKILGSSALYTEPNQTTRSMTGILPLMSRPATSINGGTPGEISAAPTSVSTKLDKLTEPSPTVQFQGTGAQRLAAQREAETEKKQSDLLAQQKIANDLAERRQTFLENKPAAPDNSADNRLQRSLQFHTTRMDKLSAPFEAENQHIAKLQDALSRHGTEGSIADAIAVPNFLGMMAGGSGSGLRMTNAELNRIIGGRGVLDSLEVALGKFVQGQSLSDDQVRRMKALADAVESRNHKSLSAIEEAGSSLIDAGDTNGHARVMNDLKKRLQQIQQGTDSASASVTGGEQTSKNYLINGQWLKGKMVNGQFVPDK